MNEPALRSRQPHINEAIDAIKPIAAAKAKPVSGISWESGKAGQEAHGCSPVPLLDHHSGQCCWIISDVWPVVCCGASVVDSSSWCRQHSRRVSPRWRAAVMDYAGIKKARRIGEASIGSPGDSGKARRLVREAHERKTSSRANGGCRAACRGAADGPCTQGIPRRRLLGQGAPASGPARKGWRNVNGCHQ